MADNLLANPQNMAAGLFKADNFSGLFVGPWFFITGSVVAGASDPQGGTTAFRFVEDTANQLHGWFQLVSKPAVATIYRFSAYVKQSGSRNIELAFWSADAVSGANTIIDGITGAILVGPEQFGTGFTFGPATVVAVGNGYFLFTFDATIDATRTSFQASMQAVSGVTDAYTGDGASGIFAWSPSLIVMPSLMPSRVVRI